MARKAIIAKADRKKKAYLKALSNGKKPHHPTKVHNVCACCGRTRWYLWQFGICRICFREKANAGLLPGVRKSSW